MERANCRDVRPDTFFPESGNQFRAALRICTRCVVKDACLEYALNNHIVHGIWGGTSERGRRRIAATRRDLQRLASMPGPDLA
jgi:WhiB family redox-sensing transcriptional regulator